MTSQGEVVEKIMITTRIPYFCTSCGYNGEHHITNVDLRTVDAEAKTVKLNLRCKPCGVTTNSVVYDYEKETIIK
jgi:hypothetical protein